MQENVPLAPLTTFKVGGPARFFLEARTISEIDAGVAFARSRSLPLFVLGGGSNLVVSDSGWPGLVLKIAISGTDESTQDGRTLSRRRRRRGVGQICGARRSSQLRRRRVPERHPRQRGRNSGAERRRLRAGSRERHRFGHSFGSARWPNPPTLRRGLRIRLSQQRLQRRRARALHPRARDLCSRPRRRTAPRLCRPQTAFCGMERETNSRRYA